MGPSLGNLVRHLFQVWVTARRWEMRLVRPQSAHVGFRHHNGISTGVTGGVMPGGLTDSGRVIPWGVNIGVVGVGYDGTGGLERFQLPIACSTLGWA